MKLNFLQKKSSTEVELFKNEGCILLFSHQVTLALPSPQMSLTSRFGMLLGISSSLSTHPNRIKI